jgi:hypothetical protein
MSRARGLTLFLKPLEVFMFSDSSLIFCYSVSDAIADGLHVEVTKEPETSELGFKYPVTLTTTAFKKCVEWTEADTKVSQHWQDQSGRLFDVLSMARLAILSGIKAGLNEGPFPFKVSLVARDQENRQVNVDLKTTLEAGSQGQPYIVISLLEED